MIPQSIVLFGFLSILIFCALFGLFSFLFFLKKKGGPSPFSDQKTNPFHSFPSNWRCFRISKIRLLFTNSLFDICCCFDQINNHKFDFFVDTHITLYTALVSLYNSTSGPFWTIKSDWLDGDPCTNRWYAVTCDSAAQNVTALFEFSLSFFFCTENLFCVFSKLI